MAEGDVDPGLNIDNVAAKENDQEKANMEWHRKSEAYRELFVSSHKRLHQVRERHPFL